MNNCFYRTGIKLFVCKSNKFLLCKDERYFKEGKWSLPGGRLEFNETIEECIERKIKEELNATLLSYDLRPLLYLRYINEKNTQMAHIIYQANISLENYKPSIKATEVKFVTLEEAFQLELFDSAFRCLKEMQETGIFKN